MPFTKPNFILIGAGVRD